MGTTITAIVSGSNAKTNPFAAIMKGLGFVSRKEESAILFLAAQEHPSAHEEAQIAAWLQNLRWMRPGRAQEFVLEMGWRNWIVWQTCETREYHFRRSNALEVSGVGEQGNADPWVGHLSELSHAHRREYIRQLQRDGWLVWLARDVWNTRRVRSPQEVNAHEIAKYAR